MEGLFVPFELRQNTSPFFSPMWMLLRSALNASGSSPQPLSTSPPTTPPRKKRKRPKFVHATPDKYDDSGETTPYCEYSSDEDADVTINAELIKSTIMELDRALTNYKKHEPKRYARRKKRITEVRRALANSLSTASI
jgi:hypothetical protein